MTFVKGQSGNPGGRNIAAMRIQRMIEGLGPRAVSKLEKLLDSDNDALAFQAAKEILARVAPIPKLGSIAVTHSASPHLAALVTLASATASRLVEHQPDNPHVLDVSTLISADVTDESD